MSMIHERPVLAGSRLEAGERIEQLRQRRVELRGQEREALLNAQSTEDAAQAAIDAEVAAAGRKAAGLSDETGCVRARTAVKVANLAKRTAAKRTGELSAAVRALEVEIDSIFREHRDELLEEARETFAGRAGEVLAAGDVLRRRLAELRESAVSAFVLVQTAGGDTSQTVQPDTVKRLERAVGELLGQVPVELPAEHALVV